MGFLSKAFKIAAPVAGFAMGGVPGAMMGSAIGGAFGGRGRSPGNVPQPNPADAANPYLNQIPQFGREAYQDFINQGKTAFGKLPDYESMANSPIDFLNMLMSQYQPSAGYQHRFNEALKAAGAGAAAGGVAGTPSDIINRADIVNQVLGQDQQQFLNNVLGLQGLGTAGLENQVERGYNAATGLADYLGGAYGQMGQNAFAGRQQQNQAAMQNAANRQSFLNSLLGAGAMGFGNFYGGQQGYANPGSRFVGLDELSGGIRRGPSFKDWSWSRGVL